MRITYLAQRVPYPADRGDKIITFNTVRHLAQRHSLSVFCLADGHDDLENIPGLRQFVSHVDAVRLQPKSAMLRGALSIASGAPLTLGYFNEPSLQDMLDRHLEKFETDLILVFSSGMAGFVRGCSTLPRVIQFGDLDSQKWAQYAKSSRFPISVLHSLESRRLLEFEREIASSFSHSIVCTPDELADFHRLIGRKNVSCVSNGVDLDHFSPGDNPKTPGSIIFTGVMDYQPNVDAMLWFTSEILPIVREKVPSANLTICGSRPSNEIQKLATIPYVTVTGRVPDVVPFLRRSQVAVVPMRLGRGIQNKLLEAMAAGLPCVATSKGFEGAEAEAGEDLHVADSAESIAQAVIELLACDQRRRLMGQNARETMEKHYHWDRQLRRLDEILEEAVTR